MSTTVNASVFADVISFSWKFRPPGFWWVTHSSFNMEKKKFPSAPAGAWVTIKDKTNGLLIVEIWWTDKCGSKKCLHKPGKNTPFLGTLLQKLIGSSLETTSLYKKHISTGPGITSCRTCDCFKICVELNGTICSWQRQRFDTWRSNSSS